MKLFSLSLLAFSLAAPAAFAAPPTPMKDIPAGHWAASSAQRVTQKKIMTSDTGGKFNGSKVVTRYELAVALDKFVKYIEAGRKPLTPGAPGVVKMPADAPADARAALTHLQQGRFLSVKSPLVVKPGKKPVTASELSDALAEVTIRLSDRALPETKHDD